MFLTETYPAIRSTGLEVKEDLTPGSQIFDLLYQIETKITF
jgi:hypothetical protein